MTSTAKSAPSSPSWTSPVCDSRMNCDWSWMMATWTMSPYRDAVSAKAASTASATSMVFAPARFVVLGGGGGGGGGGVGGWGGGGPGVGGGGGGGGGLPVGPRVAAGIDVALLD